MGRWMFVLLLCCCHSRSRQSWVKGNVDDSRAQGWFTHVCLVFISADLSVAHPVDWIVYPECKLLVYVMYCVGSYILIIGTCGDTFLQFLVFCFAFCLRGTCKAADHPNLSTTGRRAAGRREIWVCHELLPASAITSVVVVFQWAIKQK